MVNAKTVFSAVVAMSCFAAIAVYMRNNNLSTDDLSLVEACYKMEATEGGWKATCEGFEDRGHNWDTKVSCFGEFGPDKYYYTPRELLGITNLSRNLKGNTDEETLVKEIKFVDVCEKFVTEEIYQEFEDWKKEMQLAAKNSTGRDLGWHGRGWFNVRGNYKACSIKTCFITGTCGDTAACQAGGHCDGNWRANSRGARNYLNNGCVFHDECLAWGYTANDRNQKGGKYGPTGSPGRCDLMLENYARACLSHPCDDDKEASGWVKNGMRFMNWSSNRNGRVVRHHPIIAPPPPPPPRRRRRRRGW